MDAFTLVFLNEGRAPVSKDLNIAILLDFYGELLTEKQAMAIHLYYNEDLSLAEIAEPLEISRQGVRDCIKRGEKQLLELEEKLGLAGKFRLVGEQLDGVAQMIHTMQKYENMYVHSHKLAVGLAELAEKVQDIYRNL